MKNMPRVLWGALLVVVMAAVFAMYLRPDFMVQLSNQLWACF